MSVVPGHFYGGNPIVQTQVKLVEANAQPCGQQLVSVRRTNAKGDPQDLVQLAESVQKAGDFVTAGATNKLVLIAEQIKYLQMQAQQVLEEAKRDQQLHAAACNMKKVPGNIYYLYQSQKSKDPHFSLLSPEEWGDMLPHQFLGAYKLEYDMSWTPYEDIASRSVALNRMMGAVSQHIQPTSYDNIGTKTQSSAKNILALADV